MSPRLHLRAFLLMFTKYSDAVLCSAARGKRCLPERRETRVIDPRYSNSCHYIL